MLPAIYQADPAPFATVSRICHRDDAFQDIAFPPATTVHRNVVIRYSANAGPGSWYEEPVGLHFEGPDTMWSVGYSLRAGDSYDSGLFCESGTDIGYSVSLYDQPAAARSGADG